MRFWNQAKNQIDRPIPDLEVVEGGGAARIISRLDTLKKRAEAGEIRAIAIVLVDKNGDPETWRTWNSVKNEPIQQLVFGLNQLLFRLMEKTQEVLLADISDR
jgi:hypothetical protein